MALLTDSFGRRILSFFANFSHLYSMTLQRHIVQRAKMPQKNLKIPFLKQCVNSAMQRLRLFIRCILLITTSTLFAYPRHNLSEDTLQIKNYEERQKTEIWTYPKSYDGIMQMIEDLEIGEFERKYSPIETGKVNEYLVILAKEGILSGEFEEEASLKEDIYVLMYGEDSGFEFASSSENSSECMIIPAAFSSYAGYNIMQCKNDSSAWEKTKNFVKKHKKEIIIGAAVVIAATVITVTVVSSSAGAAASLGAGAGLAGAGASSSFESNKPNSSESLTTAFGESQPQIAFNDTPIFRSIMDEQIASLKECLAKGDFPQPSSIGQGFSLEEKGNLIGPPSVFDTFRETTPPTPANPLKEWDELSFSEKAREVSANVAHNALDEITDLAKVVPQLCEEIKELGSKFLPESFKLPNSGETESAVENYENLVAKGHDIIDKTFITDQAEFFTAEAKANDLSNDFAIGIIPLPGMFSSGNLNVKKLSEAGKVVDRGGFTKAGRNLMKHGYREESVFPKPLGNPTQVNAHGQRILESILNHPEKQLFPAEFDRYGKVVDIYAPGLGGVRYSASGEFIGFLEP